MKIWGGVPSFYGNLSRHQISCLLVYTTDIELRVFKKKKNMDKMGKLYHIWCQRYIFGIVFTYLVL
jgi:hypothetical protein